MENEFAKLRAALNQKHVPRLSVETVRKLHEVLEGDSAFEEKVLLFIRDKFNARNLFFLPGAAARQILLRPEDFKKAVLDHMQLTTEFV